MTIKINLQLKSFRFVSNDKSKCMKTFICYPQKCTHRRPISISSRSLQALAHNLFSFAGNNIVVAALESSSECRMLK